VRIVFLLRLRSVKSKLYNLFAGIGLVLITFPASPAAFSDLNRWAAGLLAVVGLGIWRADLIGHR